MTEVDYESSDVQMPTEALANVQEDSVQEVAAAPSRIEPSLNEGDDKACASSAEPSPDAVVTSLLSRDTVLEDLSNRANRLRYNTGHIPFYFEEAIKAFENLLLPTSEQVQRAKVFLKALSRKVTMADMALSNVRVIGEDLRSGKLSVEECSRQILEAETVASDVASQVMRVWVAIGEVARHAPSSRRCGTRLRGLRPLIRQDDLVNVYHCGSIWDDETASTECSRKEVNHEEKKEDN